MSPKQVIVRWLRCRGSLGIDIAVDLKGFTQDSRTGIFAEHCAPLQINYLGYPGTLAAPYFDYIVADKTLIPRESQQYYSEKIIYLPHSYQVNDSKRKISPTESSHAGNWGCLKAVFVFCCFNNNYKILPATFDVWMRLLKAVERQRALAIPRQPSTAAKNLRKEAEIRGSRPGPIGLCTTHEAWKNIWRGTGLPTCSSTPYPATRTPRQVMRSGPDCQY